MFCWKTKAYIQNNHTLSALPLPLLTMCQPLSHILRLSVRMNTSPVNGGFPYCLTVCFHLVSPALLFAFQTICLQGITLLPRCFLTPPGSSLKTHLTKSLVLFNAFGCESLNICHYSTIISFVKYFFEKFLILYNLKVFTPNFHPTENHGCFDA